MRNYFFCRFFQSRYTHRRNWDRLMPFSSASFSSCSLNSGSRRNSTRPSFLGLTEDRLYRVRVKFDVPIDQSLFLDVRDHLAPLFIAGGSKQILDGHDIATGEEVSDVDDLGCGWFFHCTYIVRNLLTKSKGFFMTKRQFNSLSVGDYIRTFESLDLSRQPRTIVEVCHDDIDPIFVLEDGWIAQDPELWEVVR